jgi:uncharacterized protein (DUF2236 family)
MFLGADGGTLSIGRAINAERLVLLGWSRAILMQLAHPLVAAGVTEHSTFHGRASQAAARAHHTVRAMLALTFGDDARRRAALDKIRGIHRIVNGTLATGVGRFPAGTRYSAEDPALLLWVHVTLLDSTVDVYQRLVRPLAPAELDAYCVESLPTLFDLGGDPATAPRTWRDVVAYIASMEASGVLATTAATRELAERVLWPRGIWMMAMGPVNRAVTIALLSPAVREVYGYTVSAAQNARVARFIHAIAALRRITPSFLTEWRDARSVR